MWFHNNFINTQTAEPDIVLQLADLYHAPELCNYHCTHKCEIGQKYIPQVDVQDLPSIVLSTVATLNEIQPLVNRLIQITMDGKYQRTKSQTSH